MGQGHEGRGQLTHHGIHEAVAGWRDRMLMRQFTHLAVNDCDAQRRGLEGEAFDTLVQLSGETAMSPTVAPTRADQTRQSLGRVAVDPSPQGPECQLVLLRQLAQLDIVFQEGLQHAEARHLPAPAFTARSSITCGGGTP
jgi:cytochrome P450